MNRNAILSDVTKGELPNSHMEGTGQQCQALLEVSEAIAAHRDLSELFHHLGERLHQVVKFEFLALILHDPSRNVMRLHILESSVPTSVQTGKELPIDESPGGWVWQTQQPLVVNDIDQETRFPQVTQILRPHGVKSLSTLPLTTAQRRVGALGFGSVRDNAYGEVDLEFLKLVAKQVAVAVDNALNYQSSQSYQQELARERDRLRLLLEVNNALVSNLELRDLFAAISSSLRRVMHHEYTSLALHDSDTDQLRLYALDFPGGKGLIEEEMRVPLEGSPAGLAFKTRQPLLLNRVDPEQFSSEIFQRLAAEGLKSGVCLPLISRDRVLGTLNVASLRERPEDIPLLVRYFAQKYSRRMNKRIETIPTEAMEALTQYAWPGNIRELENFIERAVILSPTSVLRLPLAELRSPSEGVPTGVTTLEAAERQHILRALQEARWVIGGPRGAAARLGVKRTTLQSRMQKLGISRQS